MKLKSWLKELPYTLLQGSLETEVDEVVYDSRKAAPGTVFCVCAGQTSIRNLYPGCG
ncbi:hypothetical protein [Clostridium fessum]|uniref:hypothetical protein n=1 Tax=Clostridium fessum TaxID=2126740 RepID=UPI00399EFA59